MTGDQLPLLAPVEPPWWREFSRRDTLAAIEEAAAQTLDVNDPLPDTLIAVSQSLGLQPVELRMWIYDDPKRPDWSMDALGRWARRYGLGVYRADAAPAEGDAPQAAA